MEAVGDRGRGAVRKELFVSLGNTGLMGRTQEAMSSRHDGTLSCTAGGGMHIIVVCNLPINEKEGIGL